MTCLMTSIPLQKMRAKYMANSNVRNYEDSSASRNLYHRSSSFSSSSSTAAVPDVTLATNAFCSLSFNPGSTAVAASGSTSGSRFGDQESSPDLVVVEGSKTMSLIDSLVPETSLGAGSSSRALGSASSSRTTPNHEKMSMSSSSLSGSWKRNVYSVVGGSQLRPFQQLGRQLRGHHHHNYDFNHPHN